MISKNMIDGVGSIFLNTSLYDQKAGAYYGFYSNSAGPHYPEITAYALNLSSILYKRTKKKDFLERAEKCANFLINLSQGGIKGPSDNFLYSFDTGIYISGLFDLYEITNNSLYLKEAKKSLKWLLSLFNGETFLATEPSSREGSWDKSSSVHLTKLAIPLLKAAQHLKNRKYEGICLKLLDWSKRLQKPNGRFILNKNSKYTMLHPHCYATEGFLYAYDYFKENWMFDVVKNSSKWLKRVQNKDGSFFRWYPYPLQERLYERFLNLVYKEKALDVGSQVLRIWKILGEDKNRIEKTENFIKNVAIGGELPLITRKFFIFEKKSKIIYSWPTFFYLHAQLLPYNSLDFAQELF